jgi:hypothetical protein
MTQLMGVSVGIFVVLLGLFFASGRWRRRRGAADGVRQLVTLDGERVLSVEYQVHTGADDGGLREERWSVRAVSDGRLLARADLDGSLRIVARGRRHLLAVGERPRVCVIDLSPSIIAGEAEVKASNPDVGDLAPLESLAPEVSGGRLSVITAQGRRATLSLAAVDGALEAVAASAPGFDERAERRAGLRLDGEPRRQLTLRGKAVAGVDFLEGAFLVEPAVAAALVVHRASLDGEGSLLSALGDDGRPRWTTALDRSLVRDACAATVAGDAIVFALAAQAPHPAELLCVDLRDGTVRWRTRA